MNTFRTDIEVPANLSDKDLLRFFSGWRWIMSPTGPTTLDFRGANFIAPWAICLFATYAKWLETVKRKKVRILVNASSIAGDYINQAGMLALLMQQGDFVADAVPNVRMVPLTQIQRSDQIPSFVAQVMQLLQLDDPELEGAVKYSLVELLRNVVQHSSSPVGGLAMAQYYENTGLVELAVADAGLGIRSTLCHKYPEIDSDLKAVKFAAQPHVSGTFAAGAYQDMKDNAGLGLFFIRQIASLAGGCLFLGSGRALADIWGDEEGTQKKLYRTAHTPGWPGTFAVLQLRKDSIGDFDGILSVCRSLSAEARKEPAKLNLDFIEEIPELEGIVVIGVNAFEENVEEAARVRDQVLVPSLAANKLVVLDFRGIRFATQSFVHALIYKVLQESKNIGSALSIAHCTDSTREAILVVAGYASVSKKDGKEPF